MAIAELPTAVNREDGQAVMPTVGCAKGPAVDKMDRCGDGPIILLEIFKVFRHSGHDMSAPPAGIPEFLKDVYCGVEFAQHVEIMAVLAENQVSRAGTVRKIEELPSVDQPAPFTVPIIDENLVHAQVVDIDIIPITEREMDVGRFLTDWISFLSPIHAVLYVVCHQLGDPVLIQFIDGETTAGIVGDHEIAIVRRDRDVTGIGPAGRDAGDHFEMSVLLIVPCPAHHVKPPYLTIWWSR